MRYWYWGTISCHCDNFRCHQWRQRCKISDILFSMSSCTMTRIFLSNSCRCTESIRNNHWVFCVIMHLCLMKPMSVSFHAKQCPSHSISIRMCLRYLVNTFVCLLYTPGQKSTDFFQIAVTPSGHFWYSSNEKLSQIPFLWICEIYIWMQLLWSSDPKQWANFQILMSIRQNVKMYNFDNSLYQ